MARVHGTHVWLPRPEGFVDTPQFPGMGDPRSGAVIAVTELPDPYSALARGLTGEQLASQGIRLLTREPLRAGVHEGTLLHVEQEQRGILFDKWMAVLGGMRSSVMVVASCRAERASSLSSWLRALVMAARWEPESDSPGLPPFLLDAPSGFQPAQRIQHGVLFTQSGRVPGPGSEAPYLIVTPLSVPSSSISPRELSELSLERMPGVEAVELESAGPVLASGMRGYELVALGRERDTGRALVVYQLLLAGPAGFVLVQGRASAVARNEMLPQMQSAARSVRRTG
ncbi:hypothetical protein [Archangium lansingense]|uniref:DUF1795 domain-containing protein n=1 Tax=Archangium lansingense TaxID=2995310 RepID=A0ABT4A2P7_9BACT|nr:hypothetical protein [Archangium lansinium]MCY1075264.1 hypothetical protein [Archangium lansinium]